MGRASASSSSKKNSEPDFIERKRLKKLALSKKILSETPARTHSHLSPSNFLLKHHGKDIIRKSQRKQKFLFSFPGLLAPIASGGKIGDLKDLATKNPILYLQFPQGQMKLFGTIVYPKNKYLGLQFSRSGKSAVCEDCFDNMIVFSEAWWIGTKEENPEEARLDFPKDLIQGHGEEVQYDFKGGAGAGAGAASVNKKVVAKSGPKHVEQESPETDTETEYDSADDKRNLSEFMKTRHSGRTSGKTFKFKEDSSDDNSVENDDDDDDIPKEEEEEEEEKKVKNFNTSSSICLDFDDKDTVRGDHLSRQVEAHSILETKSTKLAVSAGLKTNSDEESHHRGPLVQATISTLFSKVSGKKKVEEKVQYDFKGGAGTGAASVNKKVVAKSGPKHVKQESPETEYDSADDKRNLAEIMQTRHSGRTSGRTFKFKEDSSEDNLVENDDDDIPKEEEEKKDEPKSSRKSPSSKASGRKMQQVNVKRKVEQAGEPKKRGRSSGGTTIKIKKKANEENEESDEDWAA